MVNNKLKIILGLIVLVILLAFGIVAFWPSEQPKAPINTAPTQKVNQNTNSQTGMANPASVNCEQKGGRLEIRTGKDGGQVGFCIFPDGSSCEEWQFFNGECQPKNPVNLNDNSPQLY